MYVLAGAVLLVALAGGGWYLTSGRYAPVPAVAKLTAAQAAQALRQAGFHVRTGPPVTDDNVPKGEVISTSPSGRALPGATIELTLSSGPGKVAIPDVQGRDCRQAQQTLEQAGFNVTMQLGLFGNTITRMSPTGQAPIGTTITLECGSVKSARYRRATVPLASEGMSGTPARVIRMCSSWVSSSIVRRTPCSPAAARP